MADIGIEEGRDLAEQIANVPFVVETVAFGALVDPFVLYVRLVQRGMHAFTLHGRHALVGAADDEHDLGLEPIDVRDRRAVPEHRLVLAEHHLEIVLAEYRLRDVAARTHQAQIVDADVADRAAVEIGLLDGTFQRGITTVTAAENADALRIRDALCDSPACRVGHIVLHRAAPLAKPGAHEVDAVIAGAAIVDLQHGITAAGQRFDV